MSNTAFKQTHVELDSPEEPRLFSLQACRKLLDFFLLHIQNDEVRAMPKKLTRVNIIKNSFYLKLLPITAFANYFNLDKIITAREINAALINISGRQRMLSQRAVLFALRLVCNQDSSKQEKLRQEMLTAIDLMEKSHQGLINGDAEMKLPGQPSSDIQAIYFEAPLYLDRQIREYIAHVRALAQASPDELTEENPHLQAIVRASETDLLEALEVVVAQYQKESEAAELNIEIQQAQLYQQSCTATAAAQAHAQLLEQTFHDLQRTQAQLLQTEKLSSIGQMVAGVAHEINNPVSFIYGNLRYASDYVRDLMDLFKLYQECYGDRHPLIQAKIKTIDLDFLLKDLPKVLASMQVGADRIRQIVLSLRNFSRSDGIFMKSVDIHEGIDSTLLILQHRLKARCNARAIEVVKEYGDIPPVECCAGQLNQVFMNLLSNAIDALEDIPDCVGRITIRTSLNLDRSSVIIQIADNGKGITQDVKEQLFNPFFTTKPIGKGTGLGLSISHHIVVENHGGILKCESSPEKGTEFWIEIPLQTSAGLSVIQSKAVAVTP
jgi:signal transduction histidine kinase